MSTKLPTLIDNRADNTALNALARLLPQSESLDIASGYFEIGSLLALDSLWQQLKKIRILMGDEATRRTKRELVAALTQFADESLEQAKEFDDSLRGLDAVRAALVAKQIQAKVYARAKFHAKAYIFDTGGKQLSDYAIVGSSNFTRPGLTQNLELNVLTTDGLHLDALRAWFAEMWKDGEDVSPDVLQIIERHLREPQPFEIYAKALFEYFAGKETPITAWEQNESVVWPYLSNYQRDGYRNALQIADRRKGALVCDGVGLGKTFIGLMLLEYHLHRGDNVLLIVPKSARESAWEANIQRYLGDRYPVLLKKNLDIHNHTDFGRDGTVTPSQMKYYEEHADVIIVDEAHHFRNPLRGRGQRLKQLARGKSLYMLTATPINNSLDDLYHLINYFAQGKQDYFADLAIQNLRRHFIEAEKQMQETLSSRQSPDLQMVAQSENFLRTDTLLKAVLIQRSCAYVKQAEQLSPNPPVFPERQPPQIIGYSLTQVYAGLYGDIAKAFDREEPLLNLKIYSPEQFKFGSKDERTLQHEKQVVGLIRTLMLKRLESSWKAFEASLEDLLDKLARFVEAHSLGMWEHWRDEHAQDWATVLQHQAVRDLVSEDAEEEDTPPDVERFDPKQYNLAALLPLVLSDMTQLAAILSKVYQHFYGQAADAQQQMKDSTAKDDKLQRLVARLRTDPQLGKSKVVIFTEFRDTARYLYRALTDVYGFDLVEELDSGSQKNRETVIKRFAPYYNCRPDELPPYLADPIRILISTDVLSEGLNLQDASLLMNYDLHWNPVRLMQRMGRVDRRLNMDAERALKRDGQQPLKVYIYNFLPPDELDGLLKLLRRITGKVLRISKTLGIEAPLGLPDEPQAVIKNFNETYEQRPSVEELLRLELARIAQEHPTLYQSLPDMPRRVFSGKREEMTSPSSPLRKGEGSKRRGLFCAFRFPPIEVESSTSLPPPSTRGRPTPLLQAEARTTQGELRWYFRDAQTGEIVEGVDNIYQYIRCTYDTPRALSQTWDERNTARKAIEKYLRDNALRAMQAPQGYKPMLVCWMEVG